jgi:hypothetical protein
LQALICAKNSFKQEFYMQNRPLALGNNAQAAIKFIVNKKYSVARIGAASALSALLAACSGGPVSKPLPLYRCEYGIEFTAKFVDDSVALNSTRGYDILYRGGKHASSPANTKPNSNEYSNARMQVQFDLGPTLREAIVRYPLLPLVSRCVRDN